MEKSEPTIEWVKLDATAKTKDGFPPFVTWRAAVPGGLLYATEVTHVVDDGRSKTPRGIVSLVFVPRPARALD